MQAMASSRPRFTGSLLKLFHRFAAQTVRRRQKYCSTQCAVHGPLMFANISNGEQRRNGRIEHLLR